MAYIITNQCIQCVSVATPNQSRCQSQCPTQAIQYNGQNYWIDPTLCNNCVGHYSVPQCAAACPTNGGCIPDIPEYWDRWFVKYNQLVARLQLAQQAEYWEQWFDTYSQRLKEQIQSHCVGAGY
jgi:Fe-S-cluster-containing hydrogenase component 2